MGSEEQAGHPSVSQAESRLMSDERIVPKNSARECSYVEALKVLSANIISKSIAASAQL